MLRFTSLSPFFPYLILSPPDLIRSPSHLISSHPLMPAIHHPHSLHMFPTCLTYVFPCTLHIHHILTPCFIHAPFISFYLSHVHFIHISSYHITYMQLPHGL